MTNLITPPALRGLNIYDNGICRTIKNQYYKSSLANYMLSTSRGASAVMLIYET